MKKLIVTLWASGLILALTQCSVPDLSIPTEPVSPNSITSFGFSHTVQDNSNNGLELTIYGSITEKGIDITIPTTVELNGLVATFSTGQGSTVSVDGVTQVSGSTSNDFSNPVTYKVTAEDGSYKEYSVTVTPDNSNALVMTRCVLGKDIATNSSLKLSESIEGTILANTIVFEVPYFDGFYDWRPGLSHTVPLHSSVIPPDFVVTTIGTQKTFSLKVIDGVSSSTTYNVIITMQANSKKEFIKFGFETTNNNQKLTTSSWGVITGNYIHVGISPIPPIDFNLIPTFQCSDDDAVVTIGDVVQETSSDIQDFSNPITYTVTAEDGTFQDYVVAVYPAPTFTRFQIRSDKHPEIPADVIGIITETGTGYSIELSLSQAWPDTVKPSFTVYPLDASVTVGGEEQMNGESGINTSSNATYTITEDPTDTNSPKTTYTVMFNTSI